jgi:chaperonin cofactor prefoldin
MQINKIETSKKIRVLDAQIEVYKKSKQRYEITSREVDNFSETANVYAAVGRMFVITSVPEIKDELKSKQEKLDGAIGAFDKTKDALYNKLKDQETSLRELVDTKKKESK